MLCPEVLAAQRVSELDRRRYGRREKDFRYRQKVKQDPVKYARVVERARERARRSYERRKQQMMASRYGHRTAQLAAPASASDRVAVPTASETGPGQVRTHGGTRQRTVAACLPTEKTEDEFGAVWTVKHSWTSGLLGQYEARIRLDYEGDGWRRV
ncbi:hypothetical protein BaRGS_00027567 [Batillaria attramentaria]|uniref:Uncharacterized protein n=1 Tax=Batillaria attramentaria TaxID=370345 RepID=A0ABD0K3G4_9CAEN